MLARIQRVPMILLAAAGLAVPASFARESVVAASELHDDIDEYMSRLAELGLSGALLVAKDGEVVLEKGYGLADRERRIPITPDTVFSFGSITKQLTGAAILVLEMQENLSVNDPITKYFEGVPEDKTGITLHHLLTHSSGLAGYLGTSDFEPVTREEIVERALRSELLYPVGEGYEYSNVGYSLLGAIVEKVSGKSYDRFLRDHLFAPAGMSKTGYRLPGWDEDELAHAYRGSEDVGTMLDRRLAEDGPYWNLRANGGIQSTVRDMYRWHLALQDETVLSAEAKRKYFAPHVQEGEDDSYYGYGWAIFETPRGTRRISHNGGDLGVFNADFHRYVDEDVVIVIATSTDELKAEFVSDSVAAIVFDEEYLMPPRRADVAPAVLKKVDGSYRLPSGDRIDVSSTEARLLLTPYGPDALSLLLARPGSGREAGHEELEERTKRVVSAAGQGDFEPLRQATGTTLSKEEFAAMASESWNEWRSEHGDLDSVEILGTVARSSRTVLCYFRARFDEGAVLIRHAWVDDELVDIRVLPHPPGGVFFPESETRFFSFDVSPARMVRFETRRDASGEIDSLVFQTPRGAVEASRTTKRSAAAR